MFKIFSFCVAVFISSPVYAVSVDDRYIGPLQAVSVQREGLRATLNYMRSNSPLFPDKKLMKVRLLSQQERIDIVQTWATYTEYLIGLEAIAKDTAQFYSLPTAERRRDFYLHLASFLALYRHAMDFIDIVERDPGLHTLFNEAQPALGLLEGSYSTFKLHYLSVAIAARFAALDILRKTAIATAPTSLGAGINEDRDVIWAYGKGRGLELTAYNAKKVVRDSAYDAVFPVQAGLAQWAGNVRVRRPGVALISEKQIHDLPQSLEPGDILLERREWFLTNVGIPGFWPHAALYIGTLQQRHEFFTDAVVQDWVRAQGENSGDLEQLLKAANSEMYPQSLLPDSGHPVRVIEAIAKGVVFTSLEHSAAADSIAVLRPRLSKIEKAKALLKAFHYAGRPYDYNFDFITDNALVCSELVYKSYQSDRGQQGLELPLQSMVGRLLMPANSLARLYAEQFGTAEQQMDLVLFLDGDEYAKQARPADDKAFRESWKRPKWHIVVANTPLERGAQTGD